MLIRHSTKLQPNGLQSNIKNALRLRNIGKVKNNTQTLLIFDRVSVKLLMEVIVSHCMFRYMCYSTNDF